MRIPNLILSGVIGLSLLSFSLLSFSLLGLGQQLPVSPKKVPTPEQQALQQQLRETGAKRESLRAQAKQAFDAEMAQEKAGDCPDAGNTYEFNICYGKAVTSADRNLKTYAGAIRDLLGLKYPNLTGQPPAPGPAGPQLTPEQSVAEFNHTEQLWASYLDAECTAAFHQFGGGTGGPAAELECRLRLVRSHMREINRTYDMLLNL